MRARASSAIAVVVTVVAALGVVAPAVARGDRAGNQPPGTGSHQPGSTASATPALRLADTVGGKIIVNAKGRTVFMFTKNGRRLDRCQQIHGCLTDWPAVTTTSRHPLAGPGLKQSLIGTIPFKGDERQVTYRGYPLHTYKFDFGKGSTMAIGNRQFGGQWFGLKPNGALVR